MTHLEPEPPLLTSIFVMLFFTWLTILGRVRDFFGGIERRTRKGYAAFREATEDFYYRRMYKRIEDCYNRPIGSAPGAWIDVLERTCHPTCGGMKQEKLPLTGKRIRCLNLGSYNYLGFAAHDEYCTPRAIDTTQQFGISTCSSRVDAGTTNVHVELEELVARYLGVEAALVYGMGFATNSSTIPALVGKGSLILSDALNHSSIVTGARASGASIKVFRHNDAQHLEALLRQSIADGQPRTHRPWKKVVVIVEGIYSMEGEACNLKEIVAVAKQYKAYVYLDEAHSIGALGRTGRGCCEYCGVDPKDIDIMMGTFTKSFGSCGGYIAGKASLMRYMRTHSPAHLYATAMAPGCAQQVISALKVIMGEDGTDRGKRKIAQLHDNSNHFRKRLIEMGFDVLGSWDSPVMPIMSYHPAIMAALSRRCLARHIAMVVVGFPATPLLLTRARVCISAAHTREDLDWALDQLSELADLVEMKFWNKKLSDRSMKEFEERVALGLTAPPAPSHHTTITTTFSITAAPTTASAPAASPAHTARHALPASATTNGEVVASPSLSKGTVAVGGDSPSESPTADTRSGGAVGASKDQRAKKGSSSNSGSGNGSRGAVVETGSETETTVVGAIASVMPTTACKGKRGAGGGGGGDGVGGDEVVVVATANGGGGGNGVQTRKSTRTTRA